MQVLQVKPTNICTHENSDPRDLAKLIVFTNIDKFSGKALYLRYVIVLLLQ